MSAAAAGSVRAIDCPNCGAGLPVLGGGRVAVQVCGYCGAALDASDAFRVLEVFANMERPASPFRLGMEGEIRGVRWTVIGTLGLEERWRGTVERWVDHMLFSPTHGYAWLTVEDGHAVFTRKTRERPREGWLSPAEVERAEKPPVRTVGGRSYRYFQTTEWAVHFAEGAFNFRPARGDRGTTVSCLGEVAGVPEMLGFVEGARERELELSRHAPEAFAAFGAETPEPGELHPLERYTARGRFYPAWFGAMAAASLATAVFVAGAEPPRAVLWEGAVAELPVALSVDVADPSRPLAIAVETDAENGWIEFAVDVAGPGGAPVATVHAPVSYYRGFEDGESWSEGSPDAAFRVMPAGTGPHAVRVSAGERGDAGARAAQVVAQEGVRAVRWPLIAAAAFALLALWAGTGRLRHGMMRRARGDWSEED
ncbi:DUF4178 domain-containing protein [Jannaschia sp. W003]|uniref:DUF4178 domain-containing protein n=1 Tax=Jannaschia sp. W003 TaxID=2867012 RepID=UPI0021A7FCB4|nr:DUF4178 domain-containing protein [Jannaschia sp. W003]UWQ20771.1 DUF4178 domain-containing protein [Jannaschia sp. W003]